MTRRLAAFLALAVPALLPATAAAQADPTPQETAAARARNICSDPWVTIALERVKGSVTDRRLCSIDLWANGNWGTFARLMDAVRSTPPYRFEPVKIQGDGPLAGKFALGVFQNGTLLGAGGAALVAAGGGNLVAAGGGNLIGQDGGTLISPGGRYSLQNNRSTRVFR